MSGVWPRLAAAAVAAAVLAAAPFVLKPSGVYLMSYWAVTTIAALGLNLTLGYAGQISLAQGAFVGIGAYTVAICDRACRSLRRRVRHWRPRSPSRSAGCSAIRRCACSIIISPSSPSPSRLLVFLVLRNEEWLTGGIYGINGIARPRRSARLVAAQARAVDFYVISLAMLALFSAVLWWMMRSPWGRAFVALRENPMRALSLGVDTRRYTLMAFAIGSCFGGCAGAVYAPLVQFIEPSSFALGLSLNLLLMVIVGGSRLFPRAVRRRARRRARCRNGCASPKAITSSSMRSW